MSIRLLTRNRLGVVLMLGVLIGLACGPTGPSGSNRESQNPYYRKAKRATDLREYKKAAEFYHRALAVSPSLAKAHLDLGLLYDDKLQDPLAAIYHYRQFLRLQPKSDKRQLVEDFIERAQLSYAASLPQSPSSNSGNSEHLLAENSQLAHRNAQLQAEISDLREQLRRTAQSVPRPTPQPPQPPPSVSPVVIAPSPPQPAPPPPPSVSPPIQPLPPPVTSPPPPRLHTVRKEDTLYSIALQYYKTGSEWSRIFDANRDQMRNKNELRIGQQLVIPD